MPRTIDDNEYNFLQGRRQVADFVETIYNDPALAKEAKALIKKKYPNLNIPDYDIESRVNARLEEDRQQRQQAEKKKADAAEEERWRGVRKKTQDEYGFTDEAMKDLEKMMIERNIGDYEVAASYMASKSPQAIEDQPDSSHWNFEKQAGFDEIMKDTEGWGRSEIIKAIQKDQARARGRR